MKFFAKLLVLCASIFAIFLIMLVGFSIENNALVETTAEITPEELVHGKQVLTSNDPRSLPVDTLTSANFEQADLDLIINYFLHQYIGGSSKIIIEPKWARIEASLSVPENPFGRFLNIRLELAQAEKLPSIRNLQIGAVKIPAFFANYLLNESLSLSKWQLFVDRLEKIEFSRQHLKVTYLWQNGSGLHRQFTEALISASDQNRIVFYQNYLNDLSQNLHNNSNLTEVLQPIFKQVQLRATPTTGIAENRAAILVLAFYVVGIPLEKVLPKDQAWAMPVHRHLLLNGRDDFPKHYLVSTFLAAFAGTPLANAVGTFKEIEDSHGGSGFSFNDIAADRAGTLMGELAVKSESHARNLQAFLKTAKESDIMPVTADLPEFMTEAEFIKRFGGIHGEGYKVMMKDIEERVSRLGINRF